MGRARTYYENEPRFKRDFEGKRIAGTLPFRSAKEGFFGQYMVSLGAGTVVDCFTSDKDAVARMADWDRGDIVAISGLVRTVTFNSIQLRECSVRWVR